MRAKNKSSDIKFRELVDEVASCRLCERMKNSARILGHGVGNLSAEIMFIGEAPGRLGADQTHIPFHGDTAGANFEDLLDFVGLSRGDIYVSNAVLCNPRDVKGNNSTPSPDEIGNCSPFLEKQIAIVDPKIIVTLGATALRALENLERHGLSLRDHVRTANPWHGRTLIPLYHPGQRAMIHRSFANQRSDYQFVVDVLAKITGKKKAVSGKTKEDVLNACKYILSKRQNISYFELHKLAYLAEYLHVKMTGERLTKAFFIRQKDGPYCVDLSIQRLRKADPKIQIQNRNNKLFISYEINNSIDMFDGEIELSDKMKVTLENVISRYNYPSDGELKTAVYLTGPMRTILRREQTEKLNLYNAPINFFAA